MFEAKTDEIIPDEVAKVEEVDKPVFSLYEDYLKNGGLFTEEDYAELTNVDGNEAVEPTSAEVLQIDSIAAPCKISVNPDEIKLYARLRRRPLPKGTKINLDFRPEERQRTKDLVPIPAAWMSDQRIVAEIFRAKGKRGECDAVLKRTLPPIK